MNRRTFLGIVAGLPFIVGGLPKMAFAQKRQKVTIAWSHYVGWEPIVAMESLGILKKWGDAYGVDFVIEAPMSYAKSITYYSNGGADILCIANMDALGGPVASGKPSDIIVIGDYSNGNDAILIKTKGEKSLSVKDLKGKKVYIVLQSVSEYLLAKALAANGMSRKDLAELSNVDDDNQMPAIFGGAREGEAVVTWNPQVNTIKSANPRSFAEVFDSSKIPGQIIDTWICQRGLSKQAREAYVGAWFETMAILGNCNLQSPDANCKKVLDLLAQSSPSTVQEYVNQLKTTQLFHKPQESLDFAQKATFADTMRDVLAFCGEIGLLGEMDPKSFGIQMPQGIIGNPKKILLSVDLEPTKAIIAKLKN